MLKMPLGEQTSNGRISVSSPQRASIVSSTATRSSIAPEKESPDSLDNGFVDGTTGLKGCTLTLPKYSKRMSMQQGSSPDSPPALQDAASVPESPRLVADRPTGARSASPPSQLRRTGVSPSRAGQWSRTDLRSTTRPVDRCHADLYEDAFARQQRLRDMKEHMDLREEAEMQAKTEAWGKKMREWQRWYRNKAPDADKRTHLEREEEIIRRRNAHAERRELVVKEREEDELKECTFKPVLHKNRPSTSNRMRSPRGRRNDEDLPPALRLRHMVERQRNALGQLQALATEESQLREHLRTVHTDLHDKIQREETQRVVTMLQDTDADGSTQRDLIQRVRRMVAAGHDPETAQKQIVEELVARSQDEVRRRVLEAFGPVRLEQEGDLYTRRLQVIHELETVEAHVVSLRGGGMIEEAKDMGFEFGFAERARRSLPPAPGPTSGGFGKPGTPTSRADTGEIPTLTLGGQQRLLSAGSSSMVSAAQQPLTPGGTGLSQPLLGTGLTPRSAASQSPSRQSSGQQASLSGSILQLTSPDKAGPREDALDNTIRSTSALSASGAPASPGALGGTTSAETAAAVDAARQAQLAAGAFFAARSRMGTNVSGVGVGGAAGGTAPAASAPATTTGISPVSSRSKLLSKPVSEGMPTPTGSSANIIAQSSSQQQLAPASPKEGSLPPSPTTRPGASMPQVVTSLSSNGTPTVAVSSTMSGFYGSGFPYKPQDASENTGPTVTALPSSTVSGATVRALTPGTIDANGQVIGSRGSATPRSPAAGDSQATLASPRMQPAMQTAQPMISSLTGSITGSMTGSMPIGMMQSPSGAPRRYTASGVSTASMTYPVSQPQGSMPLPAGVPISGMQPNVGFRQMPQAATPTSMMASPRRMGGFPMSGSMPLIPMPQK